MTNRLISIKNRSTIRVYRDTPAHPAGFVFSAQRMICAAFAGTLTPAFRPQTPTAASTHSTSQADQPMQPCAPARHAARSPKPIKDINHAGYRPPEHFCWQNICHLGIALCNTRLLRPRAIHMDRTLYRAAAGHHHVRHGADPVRSEEHTSELQSLMRISYAVFCLK